MARLSLLLFTASLGLISGCMSASKLGNIFDAAKGFVLPEKQLEEITLSTTEDMNDQAPVAVDAVTVGSEEAVNVIGGLTASQWFSQRDSIKTLYGSDILISSWEITPSSRIEKQKIPKLTNPFVSTFIFVNYDNNSIKGYAVKDLSEITIILKRNNFLILQ